MESVNRHQTSGWDDDKVALAPRCGKMMRDTRRLLHRDGDRFVEQIGRVVDHRIRSSLRYVSELFQLKCGPDLLALNVFPNLKEVTESFGAFNAVRNHLKDWDLGDRSITCVAVGDGATPRTGATFAFRTRWECVSIDPLMRPEWTRERVERLSPSNSRIEDHLVVADRVLVVAVHSHARLPATLRSIVADRIAVVAIPCCVELELPAPPDVEYQDFGILSPERTVRVWKNAEELRG